MTTILGTIASKVTGLAFERISSFLHHKRHKALQKAVNIMNSKSEINHNRVYHLEDTTIMYGKYQLGYPDGLNQNSPPNAKCHNLERENICK